MESNPYYRRGPNLLGVLPGYLLLSALQLLKESMMSLVRTLLVRTVQGSTKNQEILQHYKKKKSYTHNITKEEKEAIKTLREDASHMVLTADKGVALVAMDKSQYVNKCMALLDDTKVYKPCKDTTKKLHRDSPRNPQTAQQGTWFFQTTLVEQMP